MQKLGIISLKKARYKSFWNILLGNFHVTDTLWSIAQVTVVFLFHHYQEVFLIRKKYNECKV